MFGIFLESLIIVFTFIYKIYISDNLLRPLDEPWPVAPDSVQLSIKGTKPSLLG